MSFFKSEIVQEEVKRISELQQKIYVNVFNFPMMEKDDKLKHIKMLEELIEKQKLLYTRVSLSDDPEAIELKERMHEHAVSMGMPKNVSMNVLLENMERLLEETKKQLENK